MRSLFADHVSPWQKAIVAGYYDGKDSAGASEGSISMRYVSTRAMALQSRYCPAGSIALGLTVQLIASILLHAARPAGCADGSGVFPAVRSSQPTGTA